MPRLPHLPHGELPSARGKGAKEGLGFARTEVIGRDIGHHHRIRRQIEQRAVTFVRFDHPPCAPAHHTATSGRRRTPAYHRSPIDHIGLMSRLAKNPAHHGSHRALPRRTRNGQATSPCGQLRQHFGAMHHAQPQRSGRHQIGIVRFDRRAGHHRVEPRYHTAAVLREERNLAGAQLVEGVEGLSGVQTAIRPRHDIAASAGRFGHRAHAHPADADKMQMGATRHG